MDWQSTRCRSLSLIILEQDPLMGAKKNAEKCEQGSGQGKQGINGNNWPHKEK